MAKKGSRLRCKKWCARRLRSSWEVLEGWCRWGSRESSVCLFFFVLCLSLIFFVLLRFPTFLGSQHPSPNVKNFPRFEPQIWLEIITSRDAKSTCFKGSRTSCDVIIFRIFWTNFGRKRSHHVMDASCRFFSEENLSTTTVLREAKPGGFQTRVFPTFFRERSRLCRGPCRDCSS